MNKQNKQRSNEWFDARKGRFTASRISELLGVKGLGLTGENYAFEKAVELVFGIDEDEKFTTFDMQRGVELEPLAFRKFSELKNLEFKNVKEAYFFPYGDNAGASPDGVVGDDAILEIKCPRFNKFSKIVATNIVDSIYFDQMQMQMLCSNSKNCHYFNYAIFNGQEMWHETIVARNDKRINFIENRIKEAVEVRDEFLEKLIKNKQF